MSEEDFINAIYDENINYVRAYIENNGDINCCFNEAIRISTQNNDINMVKLLLKNDVIVTKEAIYDAIDYSNISILNEFIKYGYDIIPIIEEYIHYNQYLSDDIHIYLEQLYAQRERKRRLLEEYLPEEIVREYAIRRFW